MGLFFYTKKGSIISTVDLPTTEIIEPKFEAVQIEKKKRSNVVKGEDGNRRKNRKYSSKKEGG